MSYFGTVLENSSLEKDSNGNWIELPLINKCVSMLQALLLDESGIGGGLAIGDGSGTERPELQFPHPTGDKYYVVDAGYPNTKGYLAPYKGTHIRYHLPDFQS
ncbi:hypothetical protein L1987_36661 [Smallanthus sonchifolius]|uniref:Uncharacterized protein n=1 Tax=Smallanthus sonchifolius TaxID=185202 RepID=A0ACB9HFK0_9ASTR|nr:hypothetical protein L1987_36661 [Smallanthus sonchifolius]